MADTLNTFHDPFHHMNIGFNLPYGSYPQYVFTILFTKWTPLSAYPMTHILNTFHDYLHQVNAAFNLPYGWTINTIHDPFNQVNTIFNLPYIRYYPPSEHRF